MRVEHLFNFKTSHTSCIESFSANRKSMLISLLTCLFEIILDLKSKLF